MVVMSRVGGVGVVLISVGMALVMVVEQDSKNRACEVKWKQCDGVMIELVLSGWCGVLVELVRCGWWNAVVVHVVSEVVEK